MKTEKLMGIMPTMLTMQEAARKTGLPYTRIRKMVIAGEVVSYKAGTRYYVNARSLESVLNGEKLQQAIEGTKTWPKQ